MAKPFKLLQNKLSPESQARVKKRVKDLLKEMPLAELRQARHMTQEQIAHTLKIKQASVSKMESQKLDMKTLQQVKK